MLVARTTFWYIFCDPELNSTPQAVIHLSSEPCAASEKVKLCKLMAKGGEPPLFLTRITAHPSTVPLFLVLAFNRVSK